MDDSSNTRGASRTDPIAPVPIVSRNTHHIFLLNSSHDYQMAMNFAEALEKSCNLRVKIFPRDLDAKLPADMNLDHVLEKCSVVVPLLTDAFAKSESCKRASMRARKRHDRGQLVLAPMKITMVDTPEALRTLPKLLFCDPHVKKNALHFLYRMIRDGCEKVMDAERDHSHSGMSHVPLHLKQHVSPHSGISSLPRHSSPYDSSPLSESPNLIYSSPSAPSSVPSAAETESGGRPSPLAIIASNGTVSPAHRLSGEGAGQESGAASSRPALRQPAVTAGEASQGRSPEDSPSCRLFPSPAGAHTEHMQAAAQWRGAENGEDCVAAGPLSLGNASPDSHGANGNGENGNSNGSDATRHEELPGGPHAMTNGFMSNGVSSEIDGAGADFCSPRSNSDPHALPWDCTRSQSSQQSHAAEVRNFYNNLPEAGKRARIDSPIFHMRNMSNFMKSIVIKKGIHESAFKRDLHVLDLCCGKGGDLLKWKQSSVNHLVGVDIANTSIDQCQQRAAQHRLDYSTEFHTADCTRASLQDIYEKGAGYTFHITSCQFSLHYAFETHAQAVQMVRNACGNIRPGGVFIGTILDSNMLVGRHLRANGKPFGNSLYQVTFDQDALLPDNLFGAKYHFRLAGVVDLPEYLIYFKTLCSILKDQKMELVWTKTFPELFTEAMEDPENLVLLNRMKCLKSVQGEDGKTEGTISEEEWEIICLYRAFCFRKISF